MHSNARHFAPAPAARPLYLDPRTTARTALAIGALGCVLAGTGWAYLLHRVALWVSGRHERNEAHWERLQGDLEKETTW